MPFISRLVTIPKGSVETRGARLGGFVSQVHSSWAGCFRHLPFFFAGSPTFPVNRARVGRHGGAQHCGPLDTVADYRSGCGVIQCRVEGWTVRIVSPEKRYSQGTSFF